MQIMMKILKKPITATFIAVFFGFLVAGIILTLTGYNPFEAFIALFRGIFSRPKYIVKVIEQSTPIILTGVSVAFAFKTGLFNIGAEGQYIMGALVATVVGIKCNFPPIIQIPIIILAGILAGAIWGAIVGLLKSRYGIHEVITSIMLNWIAFYFCNFMVDLEAFHQPNSARMMSINKSGFITLLYNWKTSKEGINFIRQSRFLTDVLLKTDLNMGFLVAILMAVFAWFLLYKTVKGYEIRAVGHNHAAAEFAGIGVKRNTMLSMVIAGAICGLAAALTIMGTSPHAVYKLSLFENNGFNGLSVALIAGSSPIGCIFSGLLFGGLLYGGQTVQSDLGAPSEIVNITIGVIVFFMALTKIIPLLVEKFSKRRNNVGN